jgi:single-strand DNA-binding protein
MNNVSLTGRLTKDIELRKTNNGHSTCTFNIAVDGGKAADGTRRSDFPSIVAWNKTAELCAQYLHKGDRVGITGKITTSSYEKDGRRIYDTKVMATNVEFLTDRNHASQDDAASHVGESTPDGFQQVQDDELPFD